MGEPTFNPAVLDVTRELYGYFLSKGWGFHPVVSTMMPRSHEGTGEFIKQWLRIKNDYDGEAGLQLSINTTDESIRRKMFNGKTLELDVISTWFDWFPKPLGRKIALNFALTDAPIDPNILAELFNPDYFLCKLTPMHNTVRAEKHGHQTKDGYSQFYPYREHEEALKEVGFDVIVFVPSEEEERGMITCGNALLAKHD